MPYYKNVGLSPVSYFDTVINPGDIEFLPGDVMNKNLIRVKFYSAKGYTGEDCSESDDNKVTVRRGRKRKPVSDVRDAEVVPADAAQPSLANDTKLTDPEASVDDKVTDGSSNV